VVERSGHGRGSFPDVLTSFAAPQTRKVMIDTDIAVLSGGTRTAANWEKRSIASVFFRFRQALENPGINLLENIDQASE